MILCRSRLPWSVPASLRTRVRFYIQRNDDLSLDFQLKILIIFHCL